MTPWWIHKQLSGCTMHKWIDVKVWKNHLIDLTHPICAYRYCRICGVQSKIVPDFRSNIKYNIPSYMDVLSNYSKGWK